MVLDFLNNIADGAYRTVAGTFNGVIHGLGGLAKGFTEGFAEAALDNNLIHSNDVSAIRRMELQVNDTVGCVSTTHRDVTNLMATARCVAEKLNNLDIFIRDTAQRAAEALDRIQDVQETQHKETTARLIINESNNILSEVGDLQNNIEKLKMEVERKRTYIQDYRQKDKKLSFMLIVEIVGILFVGYPLVFCGGQSNASQQKEVNAMADEVSVILESLQTKIKHLEDGNSHMEQAWMREKMLSQESSYTPIIVVIIFVFMFMILYLLVAMKKFSPQKHAKKTEAQKSVYELRTKHKKANALAKLK